jgi:Ser/Thr protein kinase RdoA (MazF antagonist)
MNAKVVCDNGVFVLKITNEIDVRSLSNILEIQSWLYSEGIIVPNPVLTDSAQYFVRLDNRFVILFDFIDGRVYRPELSNIGTFLGCASELFLKL